MRFGAVKWGVFGVSSLVGAFSCSGKSLNEVGDVNSPGGQSGSSLGGAQSFGGAFVVAGNAGDDSAGGRIAHGGSDGIVGGGEGISPPTAGAGGEAGQPEQGCAGCTLVAAGQDIRGAASNDQKVLWTDYGTSDKLGNYEGNGRLLVRDLDSGTSAVLASSLGGPEAVAVSSSYAYVSLDQRDDANLPAGVVRVPLVGGPPEPLQGLANGGNPQAFFSTPDYEYWNSPDGVARIAQTAGAQVEAFFPNPVGQIFAVDDTRLYFSSAGLWTIPLAGGDATKLANYPGGLANNPGSLLQLQGDYVYGIEKVDFGGPAYLTRMPKAGGAWKRVADAHNGTTWVNIAVDGDQYLVDEQTDDLRWIFRSTLTAPNTTLAWEAFSRSSAWSGWAVTRVGIFFLNSGGLYVTPTTAAP